MVGAEPTDGHSEIDIHDRGADEIANDCDSMA